MAQMFATGYFLGLLTAFAFLLLAVKKFGE